MASVLEPEVQFAQKLASNEKPTRNKAVKKLRKYISARSRGETGGFSEEELLKLWKGLFYCLWMQDKPLLQEELSTQITTLIHHFHSYDQQLLFLRTFLSTVKREWTGIDRLRMDKFFQMVRFMFRQSFEVLQRTDWDQSCVGRFLELLSSELLQGGAPPVGLQMHVLDLYLRELAVVGAQQLTADQNLFFIEPFCKTAAKTKDRCLFRAICSSIFSLIIDQAPFAIEELLKEVDQGSEQDQDSGQASDQDEPEEEEVQLKTKSKAAQKTKATKQMNGTKSHSDLDDEEDDEDGDDEDELLDSDSEQMCDEDMGPVLQFDYGAVADKLLALSSRGNTPSRNRQRLYKIVKVLRDLSQGSFPQDQYPEEVSTDEDDEDFGSRKRMKRKHTEEEEQEPEVKKAKGKKQSIKKTSAEPNADASSEEVQKKKRKKKKKKKPQSQTASAPAETPGVETKPETEVQSEPRTASVPSEEATPLKEESETTTTADQDLGKEKRSTKKKKKNKKANSAGTTTDENDTNQEVGLTPGTEAKPETEVQSEPPKPEKIEEDTPTAQSKPKKKKKCVTAPSAETDIVTDTLKTNEKQQLESTLEDGSKTQAKAENAAANLAQKKKMTKKSKAESMEQQMPCEDQTEEAGETPQLEQNKKKKKKTTALEDVVDILDLLAQETDVTTPGKKKKGTQTAEETVNNIQKKKKKKRVSEPTPGEDTQTIPQKKKRKIPVEFEYEADEIQTVAETSQEIQDKAPVRPSQKQKKKKSAEAGFVSFQSGASPPSPLFCRARGPNTPRSANKKCVTPKSDSKKVTFGLKNNKTAEFRKSDRSLLLSPDGSSRVPFDPEQKPKCGVLKSTPVRKEKKTPGKKTPGKKGGVRARPTAADFF